MPCEVSQTSKPVPTNALCPHSRVQELAAAVTAFFTAREAEMAPLGITWGVIVFAVGANVMCVEPLMFWNDLQFRWHDRITERSNLSELASCAGPTPAAQRVQQIRGDLVELFTRLGCAHVQIGRSYPWAQTREPESLSVLRAIKQTLDPMHRVNPGSLGL